MLWDQYFLKWDLWCAWGGGHDSEVSEILYLYTAFISYDSTCPLLFSDSYPYVLGFIVGNPQKWEES